MIKIRNLKVGDENESIMGLDDCSEYMATIYRAYEVDLSDYRQKSAISLKAQQLAERHLEIWRSSELRKKGTCECNSESNGIL